MLRKIRWIAILAFLVVLLIGTAQAWPSRPILRVAPTASEAEGLLETAWTWLASVFHRTEPNPTGRPPSKPHPKAGCGSDPNGKPIDCE
jgi:hypothetical protein